MSSLLVVGLTNAVWATVLGLMVLCITRVWKNPHLAHGLWLIVLLKLATPPLVNIPLPIITQLVPSGDVAAPAEQTADTPYRTHDSVNKYAELVEPIPNFQKDSHRINVPRIQRSVTGNLTSDTENRTNLGWSWTWWVGMVWLTGSALWTSMACYRILRFHSTLRAAKEAPERIRKSAKKMMATVKLTTCPRLRVVDNRLAPTVWPLGRTPTIILSKKLLDTLTEDEINPVLAHEFAHLVRRDHWVRWFEILIGVFFGGIQFYG